MKHLLNRIYDITKKYEDIELISGSRFNLFNVLNITSDEVRLHSKFIAELLNPVGTHGQGDIFLDLFVKYLNIKGFDYVSAKVEVEKFIGPVTGETGGRIDIYIYDKNNHAIVIENKVFAHDQKNQLVRYHNFSKDNVLYLCLFGDPPSENSYGNLKPNEDFRIISYSYEIISWLEKCRKEAVEFPLLREGITHYINLVKQLTGQSKNQAMINEITKIFASSVQNMKSVTQIEHGIVEAKIKIQWDFWKALRNRFELEQYLELISSDSKFITEDNVRGFYTKSRNRDKYYGVWFRVYQKQEVTIHFGVEIENEIYYGFTMEKNGKGNISALPENLHYRELVQKVSPKYQSNQWWIGWKYPPKKLDFLDFSNENVYSLADKEIMTATVDEIVKESVEHIKELQRLLNI